LFAILQEINSGGLSKTFGVSCVLNTGSERESAGSGTGQARPAATGAQCSGAVRPEGMSEQGKSTLRVAGLKRTYRRAYRPPDGLSRNFDDLGPLDGGHILADSFLTLCYPAGGDSSYPYSAGGHESRDPKSSVGVQPKGDPACRSRAPEVQYHLSATLVGQQVRTSSGAWRHSPNYGMPGVSRDFGS